MRASWVVIASGLVSACDASSLHVPAPPLLPDTRAVLLVIDGQPLPLDAAGEPALYAYDAEAFRGRAQVLEFPAAPTAQLYTLRYTRSLADLGFTPGPVPRPGANQTTRAVPTPAQLLVRAQPGDGPWQELSELPESLASRRLTAVDPTSCWSRGGCANAEGVCETCPLFEDPEPPAPPEPPLPPSIFAATCPARSSTVSLFGAPLVSCAADPPLGPCPPASARPPTYSGCTPIGDRCPQRWPTDLPPGSIRYVDEDAAEGGDGSEGAPFRELRSAIDGAPANLVIAVAAGRYQGPLELPAGARLIGACSAQVVIDGPTYGVVAGGSVEVRQLQIRTDPALSVIGAGAHLTGSDLYLEGTLEVSGGTADVARIVIRTSEGPALQLSSGARVTLRGGYVEGTPAAALAVEGASLDAEEVVIRGDPGGPEPGVAVGRGGQLVLRRGLLEDVSLGVNVLDPGSLAELSDLILRRTRGPTVGPGFNVAQGGTIRAQRIHGRALGAQGMVTNDGTLEAEDVDLSEVGEVGILATGGGTVELSRVKIQKVGPAAIRIEANSRGEVEDLDASELWVPDPFQLVEVVSGELVLKRAHLHDSISKGLGSSGDQPTMEVEDLELAGLGAAGIYLNGVRDRLSGARIWIHDTGQASLYTPYQTNCTLLDLRSERAASGIGNRPGALTIVESSNVELDRFLLEGHPVALDLEPTVDGDRAQHLRRGLIRNNDAAMLIRGPLLRVPEILDRVAFESNRQLSITAE
ncbi:MAG: hypothetical protein IPG45_24325 [Deltaproteobacteria bacterium]|nr:hypothetical protein [Deltaproteobacteria bacterium]